MPHSIGHRQRGLMRSRDVQSIFEALLMAAA